ncbi:poly(3-hydroxybutyrate) depolymerase [Aureococcus anophagefferens]|nr:poly(3-hydroxybutyrate) depolymerase [Aureococcus anophagefferens]
MCLPDDDVAALSPALRRKPENLRLAPSKPRDDDVAASLEPSSEAPRNALDATTDDVARFNDGAYRAAPRAVAPAADADRVLELGFCGGTTGPRSQPSGPRRCAAPGRAASIVAAASGDRFGCSRTARRAVGAPQARRAQEVEALKRFALKAGTVGAPRVLPSAATVFGVLVGAGAAAANSRLPEAAAALVIVSSVALRWLVRFALRRRRGVVVNRHAYHPVDLLRSVVFSVSQTQGGNWVLISGFVVAFVFRRILRRGVDVVTGRRPAPHGVAKVARLLAISMSRHVLVWLAGGACLCGDPWCRDDCYDWHKLVSNARIIAVRTNRGGHNAWHEGFWPLGPSWAVGAATDYISAVLEQTAQTGWLLAVLERLDASRNPTASAIARAAAATDHSVVKFKLKPIAPQAPRRRVSSRRSSASIRPAVGVAASQVTLY